MIELLLMGGLGNQMFQYAFARNLQLKLGEKMVINTNLYRHDRYGRSFSLGACNIPFGKIDVIDHNETFIRWIGGGSKYARNIVYNTMKLFGIYIWKGLQYREIDFDTKRKTILGYFQSERYFKENANTIKRELRIDKQVANKNRQILQMINEYDSVCVHIRRGDYVDLGMIVCDPAYYWRGITYMKEHISNPKFFIFSEDIEWAKQNVADPSFIYVDNGNKDYEEMQLMYSCKHFILSNSSFSWWAQYLSDNQNKIVTAPKIWMIGKENSFKNIYMAEWVLL